MSLVILFYVIIIPLIPFITGKSLAIAPLAGPLGIISLQLFLGVTVKSIYLANNKHLFSIHPWLQRSNDSFERAIIFMSLFSFLLCLGYWLSTKYENKLNLRQNKNFSFSPLILNKKSTYISLIIAVAISLSICSLYLQQRGLLGLSVLNLIVNANVSKVAQIEGLKNATFGNTFGFTIQFFIVTKIYLLIFFSNLIASGGKINKIGFALLLGFCLFQIVITGRRNQLITLAAPLIIMAKMSANQFVLQHNFKIKQKQQKIINRFLLLIIPVSIIIFAFITYVRGGFDDNLDFNILLSINNFIEPILESTYFTDINVLGSIMERMKSRNLDFMMGQSYFSVFYGFIPRFLWSDKPAISLGIFVKNEIFGLRGTLGGIPPTTPGEAFINFGWWGLIVPIIYGFLLRKFEYLVLSKYTKTTLGLYLYSLLIFPLSWSLMQSSFAIIITSVVSSFILIVIVYRISIYLDRKVNGTPP